MYFYNDFFRQPMIKNHTDPKLTCQKDNGNCSHLCLLSSGNTGYQCACPHLMKIGQDSKTCVPNEKFLIMSRQNEIRGLDFNNHQTKGHNIIPPLSLPKIGSPLGLDFDAKLKKIYWFDSKEKQVMRSSINGTNPEVILDDIIMTDNGDDFEAFAIDWITGNIYFATSVTQVIDVISESTSEIFVTSSQTEFFRSIIHKNPGLIKGIVLAPTLGQMYWHDKGKKNVCLFFLKKKSAFEET